MKKILLILTFIIFTPIYSQTNDELIILAGAYHNYHWKKVDKKIFKKIDKVNSPALNDSKSFISEVIKTNNQILTQKYLTKPSLATLKYLFIIKKINYNMFEQVPIDNNEVISNLEIEKISYDELLASYYNLIFGGLVNKHYGKDFSDINLDMTALNLTTETERGIFFLVAMERFGMQVWGLMNIPAGKKYKEALEEINKWPKFNGKFYSDFHDFDFPDFKIEVDKRKPKVSFKEYYLNKYNITLVYNNECLKYSK